MIKESLFGVRDDSEQVLGIYDLIEINEEMTEQLFTSTFKPRMVEIVKKLEDIETLTSQMTARCLDAREQAAKEERQREHEARTRDRDRIQEREPGGEQKWHI